MLTRVCIRSFGILELCNDENVAKMKNKIDLNENSNFELGDVEVL